MSEETKYYEVLSKGTGMVVAISKQNDTTFNFHYAEISKEDYDRYATGQLEFGSHPLGKVCESKDDLTEAIRLLKESREFKYNALLEQEIQDFIKRVEAKQKNV